MSTRSRSRSFWRIAPLLSVVAVLTSCDNPFGPNGAEFGVGAVLSAPLDQRMEVVTRIRDARVALSVDGASRTSYAEVRRVAYGTAPVSITVRDADGDTLATVEFEFVARRDWNHSVSATIARVRPFQLCMGIVGAAALAGSPSDSLFVFTASMPEGAICM